MNIFLVFLLLSAASHADWKIISFGSDTIYAKLGLKEGDVVQSINGNPTNNKEDLMALDDLIKRGKKIEIEITRDDQTKIITVEKKKP